MNDILKVVPVGLMAVMLFASAVFPSATAWADQGRTFYVDYEEGDDGAAGTAPALAFRHAPGDPQAEEEAAGIELRPGDRIIFKGGVRYRGSILVQWSGEDGAPIVYDGNRDGEFGEGAAILDGGDPVTGWRRCASAEEAGGNPEWENIYMARVPAAGGMEAYAIGLVQGERMLFPAQYPNPEDPFYCCATGTFLQARGELTHQSLQDPRLADIGDNLYGAYVLLRTEQNFLAYQRAEDWDEDSRTVTFERSRRQPVGPFSITNSLSGLVLSRPGEYVFIEEPDPDGLHRLYAWPWDNEDPNDAAMTANAREKAFDFGTDGTAHVTIQGFRMQHHRRAIDGRNIRHVVIRDNEIVRFRGGNAIHFVTAEDLVVENNTIEEGHRSNAIQTRIGRNITYRDNLVRRVGRSPLRFYDIQHSRMVGNTVLDCRGIHSNPFTIYVNISDILVAHNTAHRSNIGLTLNDAERVYVIGNIFTSSGGSTIGVWDGRGHRGHVFLNNFIGVSDGAFFMGHRDARDMVIKNNIITGMGGYPLDETHELSHNLYLSPQTHLHEGEFIVAEMEDIFIDPENYQFEPIHDGPAVDMGTDVSDYYPRDKFPDFDFDRDFAGNPRVYGERIDIGPFEVVYPEGALEDRAPIPTGAAALPERPIDSYEPVPDAEPIVIKALDFIGEGGGEVGIVEPERQATGDFLRHWNEEGHWLEWTIEEAEAGQYEMSVRYTCQFDTDRKVAVNGDVVEGLESFTFAETGGWANFRSVTLPSEVVLSEGENVLRLTSHGGRGLNVDEIRLRGPEPDLVISAGSFTAEGGADNAVEVVPAPRHGLFRGWNDEGHWLEWEVEDAEAGLYRVQLHYATLSTSPRRLEINGEPVEGLESFVLERTAGWRHCRAATLAVPVRLEEGYNVIRMTSLGGFGLNLDELKFIPVE